MNRSLMYNLNIAGFIVFLAIAKAAGAATVDSMVAVDTVFAVAVRLGADSIPDTITCRISALSWKKPFSVIYTIKVDGIKVFSETSNDGAIDQDFADPNMMDFCEGYIPCKKKWYLTMLPKDIVKIFKPGDEQRMSLLDTASDMSLMALSKKYYQDSLGYSKQKAGQEMRRLLIYLQKKDIVCIIIPAMPIYKSFPRFYDPLKKRFIQLYGY